MCLFKQYFASNRLSAAQMLNYFAFTFHRNLIPAFKTYPFQASIASFIYFANHRGCVCVYVCVCVIMLCMIMLVNIFGLFVYC